MAEPSGWDVELGSRGCGSSRITRHVTTLGAGNRRAFLLALKTYRLVSERELVCPGQPGKEYGIGLSAAGLRRLECGRYPVRAQTALVRGGWSEPRAQQGRLQRPGGEGEWLKKAQWEGNSLPQTRMAIPYRPNSSHPQNGGRVASARGADAAAGRGSQGLPRQFDPRDKQSRASLRVAPRDQVA